MCNIKKTNLHINWMIAEGIEMQIFKKINLIQSKTEDVYKKSNKEKPADLTPV